MEEQQSGVMTASERQRVGEDVPVSVVDGDRHQHAG